MSVIRQGNFLGQARLDVAHLRSVESAVAGDFDLLAGTIIAGKAPLVVSGFRLITTGATLATSLQLQVADSTLLHFYASESGTLFHVPADRDVEVLSSTNARVVGSWTPSQTNYIGLDLVRTADATTSDRVQFMDTNSLVETPKDVPLARTLDYRIIISTTDFDATPGILPLARVAVDPNLQIIDVKDSRQIIWRLGSGGTSPNALAAYPWPTGRKESGDDDFSGADKAITSFKDWMDAVMSRLWEVGGGEHWYSAVQDRNVVMARTGSVFTSSGEHFEWSGSNLHWKGLRLVFSNSTAIYNTIADVTSDTPGLTDLADGECIYVDVDRATNAATLNALKAPLALLGSPDVVGSRWVLAWRSGSSIYVRDQSYAVGSSFKLATDTTDGAIKLSALSSTLDNASDPRVVAVDSTGMGYAAGISRGGPFGVLAGGLGDGTVTIGGGTHDTAIDIKTGGTGPATIRSDSDTLTLLANEGNAVLEAGGAGGGDIYIHSINAGIRLRTENATPVQITAQTVVEQSILSNITAAASITLAGNWNHVTGATAIDFITIAPFGLGSKIYLRLGVGVTVNNNTAAPPGGKAAILLRAGMNYTTGSATSLLILYYDGTNWVEAGLS